MNKQKKTGRTMIRQLPVNLSHHPDFKGEMRQVPARSWKTEPKSKPEKIHSFLQGRLSKNPTRLSRSVYSMIEVLENDSDAKCGVVSCLQIIRTPVLEDCTQDGATKLHDLNRRSKHHYSVHINGRYRLERHEKVSLKRNTQFEEGFSFMNVDIPGKKEMTVRSLLERTLGVMRSKTFLAWPDKQGNQICQDFVMSMLLGNDLLTEQLQSFVENKHAGVQPSKFWESVMQRSWSPPFPLSSGMNKPIVKVHKMNAKNGYLKMSSSSPPNTSPKVRRKRSTSSKTFFDT